LRLRRHLGADAFATDDGDLDHVGTIVHAMSLQNGSTARGAIGLLKRPDFVVALQRQHHFI
jgi:hypothetical protein